MFENTLFMIRNGEFGTDFNLKLIWSLVGLAVCVYYWIKNKKRDYFWVFMIGSAIWFAIEYGAQLTGVRVMGANYLFGVKIPVVIASILRGSAEGGFVALFGLLFFDKISDKKSRLKWSVLSAIILTIFVLKTINQGLPFREIGGQVASRRDLFGGPSLLFMAGFIIFDIIWLFLTKPEIRKRALGMFSVMVIVTGIWTLTEFFVNTRWIELGPVNALTMAPPLLQFLGLAYDVIVEIGLFYIPFLAIPYFLGLIKNPSPKKPL